MISLKKILVSAFLVGVSAVVHSQYITVDESRTIDDLVTNVLVNNPCANVSNISVTGINAGSGDSFGYFSAGSSTFPFAEGIVLTTGFAASAVGPNSSILSEGSTSWFGDPDLEQALGVNNTINATVVEFDFLPLANKISFDYIFSSEQYLSNPSSNQCNYTDGFAFLLKEANTATPYQNLAVVPNTNIPVKVNTVRGPGTVCPAANQQYFGGFNSYEHPTNYNGQTVILTAKANVVPNTLYHIKLVVADQGNNLYDSAIFLGGGSFKVEKDLGNDRLVATNNPVCAGDSVFLDATEPGTNTYQWFQNNIAIPGETNPTYTVTSAGTYSVQITLNSSSCVSTGEIVIEYVSPSAVSGPQTLVQCDPDNDGISIFNLSQLDASISPGGTIVYYPSLAEAQNDQNPIANPAAYSSIATNQVTAAVANAYGCISFVPINLQLSNQTIGQQNPVEICDDATPDGLTVFDLEQLVTPQVITGLPPGLTVAYYSSQNDALTQTNQLPNLFSNTQAAHQTVYARIVNGADCYGIIPILLVVNTFAPSGFVDQTVYICSGSTITLQVPPGYASYVWSSGGSGNSLLVSSPGNYSVTVTNSDGCSATKTFIVVGSSSPVFVSADIADFAGDQNSVLIHFTGTGDYEFSLNGQTFQDNPLFTNLSTGEYTVFINDKNGCPPSDPATIYVLDYPRFFTPNDDGFNDFWGIIFPEGRDSGVTSIYDRYGKLLFTISNKSSFWDGKLNGHPLPSSDYWFVLKLQDNRTVRGHFSLKR